MEISEQQVFLKRDYSKIRELSDKAIETAELLSQESDKFINHFENHIQFKIDTLNSVICLLDSAMNKIPLDKKTIETFSHGNILFSEAKSAFVQQNFKLSNSKVSEAEKCINTVYQNLKEVMQTYFEQHKEWSKWKEETVKWSKKNKATAIIVDKCEKTCMVYQNGKMTRKFNVELGPNWIGDKRQKGDRATPEGKYLVTKKINGRHTKYYKALLINYPNDEDQKRFELEKKNGTLPKNADIGGLIEIHGDGGKGFNWTNGCVALTNKDMDIVYSLAGAGTPVTIIGSEKELKDVVKLD
ncbi:MAG: L,D-transpeptidase family protein [Bacteroidales bacterium]|nr:L,D-transpeptidase family protein [Bacteroidales bacterium]